MTCPHANLHDAGTCPAVRPELEQPIPHRMRKLAVDARGFPVPWFVVILPDGTPEFRAMSTQKWARAVRHRLCWVCGEPLGRFLTFVIGPMCGVNRTTSEPACHLDCAEWSARNCPFLSRPQMVRRDADPTDPRLDDLHFNPAGFAIARNPGVTLLWTTRTFWTFQAMAGGQGTLIRIGDPEAIAAYRDGRPATRAEVDESVRSGLPALQDMADAQARVEPWVHPHAHLAETLREFTGLMDRFVA